MKPTTARVRCLNLGHISRQIAAWPMGSESVGDVFCHVSANDRGWCLAHVKDSHAKASLSPEDRATNEIGRRSAHPISRGKESPVAWLL